MNVELPQGWVAYNAPQRLPNKKEKLLIRFGHGLGDAVQLTAVLQHLRRERPSWWIEVAALIGKQSAARGLADKVYHDREPKPDASAYDHVFDLKWQECNTIYSDSPSTKAARCLRDVFGIAPNPSLMTYTISVGKAARAIAEEYLDKICTKREDGRYKAVVLHYQGNTASHKKDILHDEARSICETIRGCGYTPIILDWDKRSPLPDGKTIFCPALGPYDLWGGIGTGDAERIAALIEQAALFIGVDSGPLHVAGSTRTPSLALWTAHHPIRYFDLADNVLHLLPDDHKNLVGGADLPFFEEHYRHSFYSQGDRSAYFCEHVARELRGSPKVCGFMCHPTKAVQDRVVILDVYSGDAYKTKLLATRTEVEYVVDIGAHIGCFARLWHEKNPAAKIVCVEACPENIELLCQNVGEFAEVVQAACTYEKEELFLLNACGPKGQSTGGSRVVTLAQLESERDQQYSRDKRRLAKKTLHEIMAEHNLPRIDVLKLDCEGSEYSILAGADLTKIAFIVGEYHGYERWETFRSSGLFKGWSYGHMSRNGEFGTFHLRNDKDFPQGGK